MNISIICACKNRLPALTVSLNSWLLHDDIFEVIIVDWSSDKWISHLTKIDPRVKVIRVENEKYFNQPQPLNMAADFATGDYILKMDCDYVLNPYFNFLDAYKVDENKFVCGQDSYVCKHEYWNESVNGYTIDLKSMPTTEILRYALSYSPYFKYLTGLLFITRENFWKSGGYDERMGEYYAFEDDQLVQRLTLMGLECIKLNQDNNFMHLPHPDNKRFENFRGNSENGDSKEIEHVKSQILNSEISDDQRWNLEYLLAKLHVEENKKLYSKMENPYIERIYHWNIRDLGGNEYYATRNNFPEGNNPLSDLTLVSYINLVESEDRRRAMDSSLRKYNIPNKRIFSSHRFGSEKCHYKDKVFGKYIDSLNDGTKGCCASHLEAIKNWYEEKYHSYYDGYVSREYGFFCEDDLDFSTVDYWNFTWKEFIENLPDDWGCIQLTTIRDNIGDIHLRERYWDDWSVTAYIMKRSYAKEIIDRYIVGDEYHLDIIDSDAMPLIENILFSGIGKVYTIPLFVENVEFASTFEGRDDDVKNGQKNNHYSTHKYVLDWWKNIGKFKKIEEIMGTNSLIPQKVFQIKKNNQSQINSFDIKKIINPAEPVENLSTSKSKTELEELLTQYSLDTENSQLNFNLGLWYEKNGHNSAALSYFLRAAERSSDDLLAYESLIHASNSYDRQGTRDQTAKGLLQQALCVRPDRPEAYYLLAKFSEKRQWWQDAYILSKLAIETCDHDCPPLSTDVEYLGKYGLYYQKANAAWWWGKGDECRELYKYIIDNFNISDHDRNLITTRLKEIGLDIYKIKSPTTSDENINGITFSFPEGFDWGNLTYDDMITIDREIVHEKVYRFMKDVKEGDVVMDVGASVGAYTISILDQKPSKVYCIEPSKKLLKTLIANCADKLFEVENNPLVLVNKAIVESSEDKINIFGGDETYTTIKFNELINNYSIERVNFMKIDCEGGEYSIFNDNTIDYLKNNVDFIAMEIHLNYDNYREKFKNFRDNYLKQFNDYEAMSCTRQNISWGQSIPLNEKIFDDNFIDNYTCEFMIYINNKN